MRGHGRLLLIVVLCAWTGTGEAARPEKAPARASLKLRAFPGIAFPPVDVLLSADLGDGGVPADLYCPEVEWDFADGSRSVHQEDCEPYAQGTKVGRHFARRHAYRAPGEYTVMITLRRGERVVAQASTRVRVEGGVDAPSSPFSASLR